MTDRNGHIDPHRESDERQERREHRAMIRAMQRQSWETKNAFLARLNRQMPPDRLADTLIELLRSTDERVKMKALSLTTQLQGWQDSPGDDGKDPDGGDTHVHLTFNRDSYLDALKDPALRAQILEVRPRDAK